MAQANRLTIVVAVLFVDWLAHPEAMSTQQTQLPAAFASYVANVVRLEPPERNALLSGAAVTRLLDADPNKEVSAFGAVWIRADPAAYVATVNNIEKLESGGAFRVTRRISSPPQLEDFAKLELRDDDLADLRHCRVGSCELKLSENGLRTLRAEVDWRKPTAKADAVAAFRRLALAYTTEYHKGGDAALPEYRDKARPTFVADEFRSMIDRMPPLATHLPDLKLYLLGLPPRHAARLNDVSVLAGDTVRTQTDHSHQPPGDPATPRPDCRGVKDVVREPLLRDGSGAARPDPGSRAREGILVRHDQPKPS